MNNNRWILDIPNNLFKVISQGNQDGIIQHIINNIEIENEFCVEFGFNTVNPNLNGSNCGYLIKNNRWKHLFIDGGNENLSINLRRHMLFPSNICKIFAQYNVPVNLGYLSIDVDSTDLWLLEAVLKKYSPSFFSVEYNQNIPIDYAITFPPSDDKGWIGDKLAGASLKCFYLLGQQFNYSLVYAGNAKNCDWDAFFIRNDLIQGCMLPLYENFRNVYNNSIHKICTTDRYKIMLDYEHYYATRNIIASQEKAHRLAYSYLCLESIDPNMLTVYEPPYQKIRLGKDNDGGYVICDVPKIYYDMFLSAGISDDISFENDFCNKHKNTQCYAFDGTINNIMGQYNNNITFVKKNIGNVDDETTTTLKTYIENKNNIFLKMDIEGSEINWLNCLSLEQLNKFAQIVIEFHFPFGKSEISVFEKLSQTHVLVHFHGNNTCDQHDYKNLFIPNVFECTYINKKYYSSPLILNTEPIPSQLDQPNISTKPEILINYYPFVHSKNKTYNQNKKPYALIFICHDIQISLDLLSKHADCYVMFVGDKDYVENDRIIVCRNLPNNIENEKKLLTFTAWYAIIKNNLFTDYNYLCLLEYDVKLLDTFYTSVENVCKSKQPDIISFHYGSTNNFTQVISTNIIKKYTNFDVYNEMYWYYTTNQCVRYDIVRQFVDYYYPLCLEIKKDDLFRLSWYHETCLSIFILQNKLTVNIMKDKLIHFFNASHCDGNINWLHPKNINNNAK